MKKPSNVVALLQDLVSICSVNPDGDPGVPREKANEAQIAEYLSGYFKSIGLDTKLQTVYPNRPNVIGSTKSTKGKLPRIILCPHIDTVSVGGMTIDPFDPKIKAGKLYGRGSSDTKGPLASMLWALTEVLKKNPQDLKYEVVFAAVMGEEAGNDGIRHLMKSGIKADFAIAGEPTSMNPVYTHKGALWAKLTAQGKAVHSSQPQNGKNAIYQMARAVTYFEQELFPQLQKIKNKVLGAPTCSVGTITGGSKVNIVPDIAEAWVDFRLVPEQDPKKLIAQITQDFKKRKIDVTFDPARLCAPLHTPPDNVHIKRLSHVSKQIARAGKPVGAPWFCDAAICSGYGIPAIAWGPGSVNQAHTKDEFIEVKELEKGAEVFKAFLTK